MPDAADVTLVTCATLPEPDPDAAILVAALGEAGIHPRTCAWDDPTVDWSLAPLTVLRSTWNYHADREGFLHWARRAASRTVLRNPLEVVLANTHKSYLARLQRDGVPTIPTRWFARGGPERSAATLRELGWDEVVIKPAVGAGSRLVARFDLRQPSAAEDAAAHLQRIRTVSDALVQPFLASIAGGGERAITWIDGAVTHVVHKQLRLEGDAESVGPARAPSSVEQEVARQVIDLVQGPPDRALLYARIDIADDPTGEPCVVEVELVEPSLFLAQHPPALEAFVTAIGRALGR